MKSALFLPQSYRDYYWELRSVYEMEKTGSLRFSKDKCKISNSFIPPHVLWRTSSVSVEARVVECLKS